MDQWGGPRRLGSLNPKGKVLVGNMQPALKPLWEKPGEQKSKASIQGLWQGQKRAVMGCRRMKAALKAL